jgi:hypothetical protein
MTKLSGAPLPSALPRLFATFADGSVILGMSRTALYKLAHDHPAIMIRANGRSLIDLELAAVIIREMPRGPRPPNGGGNRKGRKRRP